MTEGNVIVCTRHRCACSGGTNEALHCNSKYFVATAATQSTAITSRSTMKLVLESCQFWPIQGAFLKIDLVARYHGEAAVCVALGE